MDAPKLPHRTNDDMEGMTSALKMLARAERLLNADLDPDTVYRKLGIAPETFGDIFDQYAIPLNFEECMAEATLFRAAFPFFYENDDSALEHVGSGVLLEIGDELFALSAAHVLDHDKSGTLFIPAADQLRPLTGSIAHCRLPESGERKDDRNDVAYCRLSPKWKNSLHPSLQPLSLDDLLLTDAILTGQLHTFSGYPWRKTVKRSNRFESDHTSYTGHAFPPDVYRRLNYGRYTNILIRIRRNETHSTRYGPGSPAPHPQGISGGAVFAWPATYEERTVPGTLKFAGIAHTYHEHEHCLAATRVISVLMAIVRNNPHLAPYVVQVETMADELRSFLFEVLLSTAPPARPLLGISWYTDATYSSCLSQFEDRDELPDTYNEWLALAEEGEAELSSLGYKVVRVLIDPVGFIRWCRTEGASKVDRDARAKYASIKAVARHYAPDTSD